MNKSSNIIMKFHSPHLKVKISIVVTNYSIAISLSSTYSIDNCTAVLVRTPPLSPPPPTTKKVCETLGVSADAVVAGLAADNVVSGR